MKRYTIDNDPSLEGIYLIDENSNPVARIIPDGTPESARRLRQLQVAPEMEVLLYGLEGWVHYWARHARDRGEEIPDDIRILSERTRDLRHYIRTGEEI